jgi:hypothetical protein
MQASCKYDSTLAQILCTESPAAELSYSAQICERDTRAQTHLMSFQKLKFACGSGAASSNPRTFFRKAVASICRDLDNLKAEWEMSRAVS